MTDKPTDPASPKATPRQADNLVEKINKAIEKVNLELLHSGDKCTCSVCVDWRIIKQTLLDCKAVLASNPITPGEMMKYNIIANVMGREHLSEFINRVQSALDEGWELHGGLLTSHVDMTDIEKCAYEWALEQPYQSVAARYARTLAEYIKKIIPPPSESGDKGGEG